MEAGEQEADSITSTGTYGTAKAPFCRLKARKDTLMTMVGNLQVRSRPAKWLNSPVQSFECRLPDIFEYLPEFERRTMAVQDANGTRSWVNPRLDTIVRKPHREDPDYVPVGVVSKGYVLVPHKDVLRSAAAAFAGVNLDPGGIRTELTITEYGERMHASLFFPDRFSFKAGDGYPLTLRLELFNSVDGSTQFRALMGWFRFVCSNGLIIGVTESDLCHRHAGNLGVAGIADVIHWGLGDADRDTENLRKLRDQKVNIDSLPPWVNGPVKKAWGFKAAARAYHIACSGHDVEIAEKYKGRTPSTIGVTRTRRVPGCSEKADNAYDVSQVLSWLASHRRDVQEQLQWRQEILSLMDALLN